MDEQPLARLIEAMHGTIQGHAVQLDALDEAIGDGDHGTNLARGFAALAAERDAARGPAPGGRRCRRWPHILEREAGGAGGTYYGLLFAAMGAARPGSRPAPADLSAMLRGRRRGGAGRGRRRARARRPCSTC